MESEDSSVKEQGFEIRPLDETPIGPIDTDPTPLPPGRAELQKLSPAPSGRETEALKQKDYLGVVQVLDRPEQSADEANNLGLAWAWLGYEQDDYSLWVNARAAFKKALDAAKEEGQKERARTNLELVDKALKELSGQ